MAVYLRLKVRRDRMPPVDAWREQTGVEARGVDAGAVAVATLRGAPADEHWITRRLYGGAARRGVILAGMAATPASNDGRPYRL